MKLEFLGTGAADFDINKRSDYKEFRRFSSALINDDLLIDPGPHIFDYAEKTCQPNLFDGLKYIIVTHSHGDHFNVDTVKRLFEICPDITLVGDKVLKERIIAKYTELSELTSMTPEMMKTVELGNYEISSLPANHTFSLFGEDETRHYYVVEKSSGKKLFYGADSAWLTVNEWAFLKGKRCDAMIFELTIGEAPGDDRIFSHTNIDMLRVMLQTVRKQRAVEQGGKIYTTHMARTLHYDQTTLTEQLRPMNATPAYDGMKIII